MGAFHTPIDPEAARHYLGFAGGSGITPVLSILKTVLARETALALHAGLRQPPDLLDHVPRGAGRPQERYLAGWRCPRPGKRDAGVDLFTGRIDAAKCEELFRLWVDVTSVDTAFICGPEPMMLGIAASLREHGLPDAQIKFELFASGQPGRARARAAATAASAADASCAVTVTLDGATRTFRMPKQGESLLERRSPTPSTRPNACKAGVCRPAAQGAGGARPR